MQLTALATMKANIVDRCNSDYAVALIYDPYPTYQLLRTDDRIGLWPNSPVLPFMNDSQFGKSSHTLADFGPVQDSPRAHLEHAYLILEGSVLEAVSYEGVQLAQVRADRVPGLVALVVSGNDVWAVQRNSVVGLFSKLKATLPFSVESSLFVTASEHELFVMDSETGTVAGIPHAEPLSREVMAFFLKASDGQGDASLSQMPKEPRILPPRLAAQPLRIAAEPVTVSVSGGQLHRVFRGAEGDSIYTSELSPIDGERAYAHWAPRLCSPQVGCHHAFYGESCSQHRSLCSRETPLEHAEDTECAKEVAPFCPHSFEESNLCLETELLLKDNCKERCVPKADCWPPHELDITVNACRYRSRRQYAGTPPPTPADPAGTVTVDTTCPEPTASSAPNSAPSTAPTPLVCKLGYYKVGDLCQTCNLCPAGTKMVANCFDTGLRSECVDCAKGTFTAEPWHTRSECLKTNGCPGATTHSNGQCINLSFIEHFFEHYWYLLVYLGVAAYVVLSIHID